MHSSSPEIQPKITALTLALMLATLWLLMRGYHGLTGDAQIYAFQALARIHPELATDLYLQNTSQDQFTIFSPFYAWCIGGLGLENAARLLTVLFTIWLLAAAWSVARALTGRNAAWLAVALLLIAAGDYGGYGVFRFPEQYLTARLPAEALTVTALACHLGGRRRLGLWLATGALFIHPLIALPGMLLLICMALPGRVTVAAAVGGVLATLAIAVAATAAPSGVRALTVMDPAWLEIVRERSQFLFLTLWSFHDWDINTQPFMYVAFTALAVPDRRIRKLCLSAALVGATGLAVALIGGTIGPVAILLQGQAWRWVWIVVFVSALLLPATVLQVWRDERCGPPCAVLLLAGWTFPILDGTACASLALVLWLMREHVKGTLTRYLRCASAALATGIVVWVLVKSWAIASAALLPSKGTAFGATQIRDIFGLRIPAVLFCALVLWWVGTNRWSTRHPAAPLFLCALLVTLSLFCWPVAFKQSHAFASPSEVGEFGDWKSAIPPTSTVQVAPARDVGAFVWFTLGRPNYLAVDQSAGVVFSRATALEVERRSRVLLPLMDPNWKVMTSLANSRSGHKNDATSRPLTAANLIEVCADPELGFVISPKDVGFAPLRHEQPGAWKDWNLYDCRKVRLGLPLT